MSVAGSRTGNTARMVDAHRRSAMLPGLVRLLLAAVLLLAGTGKLLGFAGAVATVTALGVPSGAPGAIAAAMLIACELALGVALVCRGTMAAAAGVAVVAFAGFALVTLGKLIAGAPPDCGCFGALLALPPPVTLLVDLGLMALSGWLVTQFSTTTETAMGPVHRTTSPPPAIAASGRAPVLWLFTACALLLGFSFLGGGGGGRSGRTDSAGDHG